MKLRGLGVLVLFLLTAALAVGGCGKSPVCQTSLVTLDETRLDAETYEQEAAETAKNAAELQKKVTDRKSDISAIKEKPAELRKKVEDLKKGSGRE